MTENAVVEGGNKSLGCDMSVSNYAVKLSGCLLPLICVSELHRLNT